MVGGAVWLGGHVMRALPREQVLLFPVGSVFPDAVRFDASWKRTGDSEPSGGVSLSFGKAPPLQIAQHAKLPDGDYVVTSNITEISPFAEPTLGPSAGHERVETSIERRVTLSGGETRIELSAGGF